MIRITTCVASIAFALVFATLVYADTLHHENGMIINGTIIEESASHITIETEEYGRLRFERSSIEKIVRGGVELSPYDTMGLPATGSTPPSNKSSDNATPGNPSGESNESAKSSMSTNPFGESASTDSAPSAASNPFSGEPAPAPASSFNPFANPPASSSSGNPSSGEPSSSSSTSVNPFSEPPSETSAATVKPFGANSVVSSNSESTNPFGEPASAPISPAGNANEDNPINPFGPSEGNGGFDNASAENSDTNPLDISGSPDTANQPSESDISQPAAQPAAEPAVVIELPLAYQLDPLPSSRNSSLDVANTGDSNNPFAIEDGLTPVINNSGKDLNQINFSKQIDPTEIPLGFDGVLYDISSDVKYHIPGDSWYIASDNIPVKSDIEIWTGRGKAKLLLKDNAKVLIPPNSSIHLIDGGSSGSNVNIELKSGRLWVVNPSSGV